jgi:hypothetical protein
MNVNDQVNRELALIPRGDFNQNQLRMIYQMLRSNALGANAVEPLTARQTLERATAMVRQSVERFEPRYDPRLLETQ